MKLYHQILNTISSGQKMLAILVDPDKFIVSETISFLKNIPKETSHIFVGGSTVPSGATETLVEELKTATNLPILIFPGDYSQITDQADGILFLSLLSGRNPEFLVGQHIKSISKLRNTSLEILSTGYLLIDGGNESAVARITKTDPMPQDDVAPIVDTALVAQYMGMRLLYLEAGSGANQMVSIDIIKAVSEATEIPLIVGGGIRTENQMNNAYQAGAHMVVMGTAFEELTK